MQRHDVTLIKRPARDAFLSIGEKSGSACSAFRFPYNSVTIGQILFKFGRCMQ